MNKNDFVSEEKVIKSFVFSFVSSTKVDSCCQLNCLKSTLPRGQIVDGIKIINATDNGNFYLAERH